MRTETLAERASMQEHRTVAEELLSPWRGFVFRLLQWHVARKFRVHRDLVAPLEESMSNGMRGHRYLLLVRNACGHKGIVLSYWPGLGLTFFMRMMWHEAMDEWVHKRQTDYEFDEPGWSVMGWSEHSGNFTSLVSLRLDPYQVWQHIRFPADTNSWDFDKVMNNSGLKYL